jgi:glyoxylase-like metal-dependent hydrolase (beta-lactamase superfamily II)
MSSTYRGRGRTPSAAFSRRAFLAGAGAVLAAGRGPASAGGAPAASGFHRLTRGEMEVTIVSDGLMDVAAAGLARDKSLADIAAVVGTTGPGRDRYIQPTNITFVRTAKDLIAIDTGGGPNFMASLGKLADNMAAAGIDPKAVTKVVYTHGHPDHLWGTVDEFDDSLRFSEAAYYMSEAELALWTAADAEQKLPSDRAHFVMGARRNIAALKDRLSPLKPGQDVVTGLTLIDTAGHTQGHVSLQIHAGAGAAPLVVLGDALLNPVVSFAHPEWRPASDHQPEVAAAMRVKLLDRLVADKAEIVGYHLPWPGLGRVERKGAAYAYVPAGA